MENFDYEKVLLEWKKNLLMLREKYRDTPAGFVSREQERKAEEELAKEIRKYEDNHTYQLVGSYQPKEESFFGRESCLRDVGETLRQGPVVLYGIGGVGKSALIREFVRRNQKAYDHILWLSCEKGIRHAVCDDMQVKISNLRYSYEKYGGKLKYYKEKIKKIREIADNIHLLLVLDNFNGVKDSKIKEVLTLPCDILVTTRIHASLWEGCQKIYIKGFQMQERKALLKECQKKIFLSEKAQKELLNYGE